MNTTGTAFKMKIELAKLIQKHGMTPRPFTPAPLRPAIDCDVSVEALAAPATVDREFMKFGAHCWMPFKKDIPLLFRHQPDRPVGKVQDIKSTDDGLFVRALVTDSEARRCPYFSVTATVHSYSMRQVDDPQAAHALITCASVDEISIVLDPANPDAIIRPTPAAIEFYDLAIRGVGIIQQQLALLPTLYCSGPSPAPRRPAPRIAPRRQLPMVASTSRRPTQFSTLVEAMNR
jgi:hypothetical protein